MKVNLLKRIVVGLVLLAPVAGCQNLTAFKPPSLPMIASAETPARSEEGEQNQKQLAPKKSAEVCFTLAESFAANGHEKEAIGQYERCRYHDPKRPGIAARLAVLYDCIGEHKQALAEFEKAIKESPNDASLHNNLGYCLYNTGKWADAEKCYRQALALDAQHGHAWVNLGMTLGMQGRYEESYEAFTKAVSAAEAHANLGFIYYTQEKKDLARSEYRQVLQLDPSLQKAQLILNMLDGKSEKSNVVSATPNKLSDVPPLPPLPSQATR